MSKKSKVQNIHIKIIVPRYIIGIKYTYIYDFFNILYLLMSTTYQEVNYNEKCKFKNIIVVDERVDIMLYAAYRHIYIIYVIYIFIFT